LDSFNHSSVILFVYIHSHQLDQLSMVQYQDVWTTDYTILRSAD